MTNREAVEMINKIKLAEEHNCEVYEIKPNYESREALNLSIQALEKQEPKKPIIITVGRSDEEVCPNCKEGNIRYPDVGWMYKHCPDCGQALKELEEE